MRQQYLQFCLNYVNESRCSFVLFKVELDTAITACDKRNHGDLKTMFVQLDVMLEENIRTCIADSRKVKNILFLEMPVAEQFCCEVRSHFFHIVQMQKELGLHDIQEKHIEELLRVCFDLTSTGSIVSDEEVVQRAYKERIPGSQEDTEDVRQTFELARATASIIRLFQKFVFALIQGLVFVPNGLDLASHFSCVAEVIDEQGSVVAHKVQETKKQLQAAIEFCKSKHIALYADPNLKNATTPLLNEVLAGLDTYSYEPLQNYDALMQMQEKLHFILGSLGLSCLRNAHIDLLVLEKYAGAENAWDAITFVKPAVEEETHEILRKDHSHDYMCTWLCGGIRKCWD